jgi:hypothetical protein
MLLDLQLSNYADAVWNPIAEEFARYGLAVISSWVRRGLIFGYVTKATGFGFPNMDAERIRVTFTSGTTQTVNEFIATGTAGSVVTIVSSIEASASSDAAHRAPRLGLAHPLAG